MGSFHISGHIGGLNFGGGHGFHHGFMHHGFNFGHHFGHRHGHGFGALLGILGLANLMQGASSTQADNSQTVPVNAPQGSAMDGLNATLGAQHAPEASRYLSSRRDALEKNPNEAISQFRDSNSRNPQANSLSDSEILDLHREMLRDKQETVSAVEAQSISSTEATVNGTQTETPTTKIDELRFSSRDAVLDSPAIDAPRVGRSL